MCVLWFNTQCLPTLTLHLIKYIIFWRTGDISEKTAHMKHAEGAAAPLVSWINQLCLLSMKSNVLVANAPTMLSASQLTWFFFIEIKGMGCLCVCALPTINYFSTPSFWIFLICPWEKPRKLQFYTALFYYLLVFNLNDRRGSVPNDESLGLKNLVFLSSSPTLTRSWRCPGLLCYLPLVLLYSVNFYFHHPHHLSVELVQGSLLFSFVPNHIQMDKSIKHKQWLCHWRSSLYYPFSSYECQMTLCLTSDDFTHQWGTP